VVPWIHHIIMNTPRPQVCVFTLQNHCGEREVCNLFSLSEERPVFLRYNNFGAVISIQVPVHTHSGPGPFTCLITLFFSRTRERRRRRLKCSVFYILIGKLEGD
jgi:hypothetical protein